MTDPTISLLKEAREGPRRPFIRIWTGPNSPRIVVPFCRTSLASMRTVKGGGPQVGVTSKLANVVGFPVSAMVSTMSVLIVNGRFVSRGFQA